MDCISDTRAASPETTRIDRQSADHGLNVLAVRNPSMVCAKVRTERLSTSTHQARLNSFIRGSQHYECRSEEYAFRRDHFADQCRELRVSFESTTHAHTHCRLVHHDVRQNLELES